jgi:AcrR family transcriptional regulator
VTAAIATRPTTDQRILEAATELFYRNGYHATTMRQIAGAIGMKAGSLYNHYASKQEILVRIAYETMQELLEGGRAALAAHELPRDQLRALISWHVSYHAEHRFKAKVADDQLHALDGESLARVIAIRDEYEQLLRQMLVGGCEQHGWVVADVPVITFAIATMSTAVGTWYRESGRLTPAQIADVYAEFVLAALEGQP